MEVFWWVKVSAGLILLQSTYPAVTIPWLAVQELGWVILAMDLTEESLLPLLALGYISAPCFLQRVNRGVGKVERDWKSPGLGQCSQHVSSPAVGLAITVKVEWRSLGKRGGLPGRKLHRPGHAVPSVWRVGSRRCEITSFQRPAGLSLFWRSLPRIQCSLIILQNHNFGVYFLFIS